MSEEKFPLRLLRMWCPDHLYDEIAGDLMQRYERDFKSVGKKRAAWRLFWNTIRFFRPGIIFRNKVSNVTTFGFMLGSYVTIMLRNLTRRSVYSAINIIGLTVGITFAMLIGAFVWNETSVNATLKDVDRLYLVENKYKGDAAFAFFSPAPLGAEAVRQHPTLFENYYRFWDRNVTISKDDRHFRIQTMVGDSTFLQMFGFKVLFGDAATALENPFSLVISEKTARQYFDKVDAVGESMLVHSERGGRIEFVVTAVIADLEDKNSVSDFMNSDAQAFIPIQNSDLFLQDDVSLWTTDIILYMKLAPGADSVAATDALNRLMKAHVQPEVASVRSLQLDPLSDYYLLTNHGAVMKLLISLSEVVAFVLLLAIANFVNITIASSFARLKEIGVRKVIGGLRSQAFFQFVAESVLLAFLAGAMSLLLYELLHGYFSDLLQSPLPSVATLDLNFYKWMLAGICVIGFLAGAYPAAYLSATATIEALKGKARSVKATLRFSRILIAAQFLIAIFVFVASVIMSEQVAFFLNKDLGFDKSYVLNVTSAPRLWTPEGFDKVEASKTEFLSVPGVQAVTISWGAPSGSLSPRDYRIYKPGQTPEEGVLTTIGSADEDYADVYGIRLLEGNFLFAKGGQYTPLSLVINEAAQKKLGVDVGDKVKVQFFGSSDFTVVGIVRDFNFETLHNTIEPVAFVHNRDFTAFRHFSFKMTSTDPQAGVAAVEQKWKQVFPDDAFAYSFIDQQLENRYKTELQLKKAFTVAAILIIIIVLIGVLGLISLSLNKRTREIGIRKVLGASPVSIIGLVSKEYSYSMIAAFTVGIPLACMFLNSWLGDFAYRIDLTAWMVLVPAFLLFLITMLVVSAQAFKTATSNPVNSIRHE